MNTRPLIGGGLYHAPHPPLFPMLFWLLVACSGEQAVAPTAPQPRTIATERARITRDGRHLRIQLSTRKHLARPRVTRSSAPTLELVSSSRSPHSTAPLLTSHTNPHTTAFDAAYPDTAIVTAREVAGVDVLRSSFSLTATHFATVVQGSWYPLYRTANGLNFQLYAMSSNGSKLVGSDELCVFPSVWGPRQQCMRDLFGLAIYGISNTFGTEIFVGSECGYRIANNAMGTTAFYHNFDRDEAKRDHREVTVTDTKDGQLIRKCFPRPEDICEDPSYCSGENGDSENSGDGAARDASVSGIVEFEPPLVESGGIQNVLVCDVTDWYAWTGYEWDFTDTRFNSCHWEWR